MIKEMKHILVPIGTLHPSPCPDCGKRLVLGLVGDRKRYMCEMGGSKCYGNAHADREGKPVGFPIDRLGRKKRVELHKLLDCWSTHPSLSYKERAGISYSIYLYMNLALNLEDFHVSTSGHSTLDRATIVAQTSLVKYAKSIGLKYKEVPDAADEFLYNKSPHS